MLQKIHQVLEEKGKLILTVFNWESKKEIYPDSKDILLEYCVPNHKGPKQKTAIAARVEKKGKVYERYYHLF